MEVTTRTIQLKKRYPFTISRGTRDHSENILVHVKDEMLEGIGECDANCIDEPQHSKQPDPAGVLEQFLGQHPLEQLSIQHIWQQAFDSNLPATIIAALDIALWDLLGKQCQKPLYQLFGLSQTCVPTSMTIGITPIEQIPQRIEQLLGHHHFHYLKIKLGSSDGIDFDKAAFSAIKQAAQPYPVKLRVDANGGWTLDTAKQMCQWLARQGVEYIEQPLPSINDDQLPELFRSRPLPIFVDESCHFSRDIPRLASCVDGINLKLMKCGGLTEALRIVATARAHGLQTMIGCMSESSIAISAAASIGALFDHIDLDSHINLDPDPAKGAELINGAIIPTTSPGHGAALLC